MRLEGRDQTKGGRGKHKQSSPQAHPKAASIPWSAAARLWVISLFGTLVCALLAMGGWSHLLSQWRFDPEYKVTALIQTGPEVEGLPSSYLMELMELSHDAAPNLYAISCKQMEKKLLQSPCIAWAHVHRMAPHTLQVIYAARRPLAVCADLENALVDEEGYLLPYQPFYRPQRLPQLFCGVQLSTARAHPSLWGKRFPERLMQVVKPLLAAAVWDQVELLWLDVSHAADASPASAAIVLQCAHPHPQQEALWVRLSPENWKEGLSHLVTLLKRPALLEHFSEVDLRMPHMAVLGGRSGSGSILESGVENKVDTR